MAPKLQRCAHCKVYSGEPGGTQTGSMLFCGGCRDDRFSYCNKECQKLGWKDHKAQCLTVNQAASSVELMALVAPLEVACRSQLDTYIDAYQRPFTAAILGALAIKHPHDLNDTHVMIIRLVWNKDAGPRIEEQFSLVEASVVTNAEFGLITGRYRGESDPTPDAQLLGSGLTLEANLASGGYYDRLATRPRIQTTLWFYTDSRLPVHSSIPVIEAYRTYTQSIIIHKGRVEPPLPLDKDWYEHLRQDLARPPISHAEHMQRTISRIDKTSQEVIQYSIEANAFREFAPETEVPQSVLQANSDAAHRDHHAAEEKAAGKTKKKSRKAKKISQ